MTTRDVIQLLFSLTALVYCISAAKNVTHSIPKCVQLVLSSDEYAIKSNSQLVLADEIIIDDTDYELSKDNKTASVCYPTSERLHKCRSKIVLPVGKYKIEKDRSVSDVRTGQLYHLGDYYIDEEGAVITCQTCNFISLNANEYTFQPEGDLFTILRSNKTFFSPKYTIDNVSKAASVCYPIIGKENCTWGVLQMQFTNFLDDKRVQDKPSGIIYELDQFVAFQNNEVVAICIIHRVQSSVTKHVRNVTTIIFVVSAACLAIAILVHLVVPDMSLQRAPLLCHSFTLMILYICLAIRSLALQDVYDPTISKALFYTTYVSGLATFAWLTVLAFDVWRISSCLREDNGSGYKWADSFCSVKFLIYSIFGWGVPVAFAAFVAVLESSLDFQNTVNLYPDILGQCWFNGIRSAIALWYIPMAVLLGLNFIFFILSVCNLCIANSEHRPFNNIRLSQQLLVILFVVFLAMGIFWVMDIVSFFDMVKSTEDTTERWLFTDIINSFQGVIIAIIYTCHPFVVKNKRAKSNKNTYNFNEKF